MKSKKGLTDGIILLTVLSVVIFGITSLTKVTEKEENIPAPQISKEEKKENAIKADIEIHYLFVRLHNPLIQQSSGMLFREMAENSKAKENIQKNTDKLLALKDKDNKDYVEACIACNDYLTDIITAIEKYPDSRFPSDSEEMKEAKEILDLWIKETNNVKEERIKFLKSQGLSEEEIKEADKRQKIRNVYP